MKKHSLEKVHILLVDSDVRMAGVVVQNLQAMGFRKTHHVRNGAKALEYLSEHTVDILITEWTMPQMDGLELVRYLRQEKGSPNRTIPIIMLTAKGEVMDVTTARDVGITEFVVKPFSAHTLFSRLEQLIDNPRPFVLSKEYTGPDRRRRANGEAEVNRRTSPVKTMPMREEVLHEIQPETPIVLLPEQKLKRKIGIATSSLASIITPEVLARAQKAIEDMSDESLNWIKEDLAQLEAAFANVSRNNALDALEEIKSAALSIKARAGTFGYGLASDIARTLYLFLSSDYVSMNKQHNLVILKHIETLKVVFAGNVKERDGMGAELAQELQRLIERLRKG